MILCDVGVLLHAMIRKASHHEICRRELDRLRSNPRDLAVSELVLAAVVRIGTNPRLFKPCPTPEEVFAFVEALRSPAQLRRISPGPRHRKSFNDLVLTSGITGPTRPTPTPPPSPSSTTVNGG